MRRPGLKVRVSRTLPEHADAVAHIVRLAHGVPGDAPCGSCPTPADVRRQVRRFPAGQFVATVPNGTERRVVGAAMLMRTSYPPGSPPRAWMDMIGGLDLRNHDPQGRWLYGVEMAVDPAVQGRGVGSALYRQRQNLVGALGLEGLYAGGMLKGYRRYRGTMSPREYAERVRRGEIADPTVTMQLHRGFEAAGIIEDYEDDPAAGNCAMLIVWRPPTEGRPRRPAREVPA